MQQLSPEDIIFLKSKGFIQDPKSGFYFHEEDNKKIFLIPQFDHYKLEFYEWVMDETPYEDYYAEYGQAGQSLEDFINFWF